VQCSYNLSRLFLGSKQIVIALDPSYEFSPVITFKKPGFAGVKFYGYAAEKFFESLDAIGTFFKDGTFAEKTINLGPEEVLEFGQDHGKRAIFLRYQVSTMQEYPLILNEVTWKYVENMKELILYVFNDLKSYTVEIQRLYSTLKRVLFENFEEAKMTPTVDDVEKFLHSLEYEKLEFQPAENSPIDNFKVFLEMKRACLYDLAGIF